MKLEIKHLYKNNGLKEKVDRILKENKNDEKTYIRCAALLEYINVRLLRDHLKVELPDFNIVRIMSEYNKIDKKLFELMVGVNGDYNTVDFENLTEDDIINLLYDIDFIYGYILEKYGDVI